MKKILAIVLFAAASHSAKSQTGTTAVLPCAPPIEVVKTFLTAYMQGDHKTFVDLLHADVVWEQPGESTVSGIKNSKAELLQMGARMSELSFKTLKLNDVEYFSPSGNKVVCTRWKMEKSSTPKFIRKTSTKRTPSGVNIERYDQYVYFA
jgi:limonene-1,2-epoxide hydrolase